MELAVKDESELLLVGLHVERWGPSSFGLVTIPAFMNSPTAVWTNCCGLPCSGSVASPQFCRKASSIPSISAGQFKSPLLQGRMNVQISGVADFQFDSYSQVLLIRAFGLRVAHRGCPQRHSAAKPQPKLGISRAKAAKHVLSNVEGAAPCHFDRREKSFLDPSHSLGMTGLSRHLAFLAP